MTYNRLIVFLLFIILCLNFNTISKENIRVCFINPGISDPDNPTGTFWLSVSEFMSAAALDLDIELEILYSERNHILMHRLAKEVASRQNKPDYLIIVNERLTAGEIIETMEKAEIKTFIINNVFTRDTDIEKYREPREKYSYWIGSLIPDNRYAGYKIGKILIEEALRHTADTINDKLHIIGISGDHATQASIERVEGLKQVISEYDSVVLNQVVPAQWNRDNAYQITTGLLDRYPETAIIWSANDPIALGALDAAISVKRKPGDDIFIGGLNWDQEGLEKVKEGKLVTTIGGHFMTGGWALVILYDYHHGRDFSEEGLQLEYQIFGALHKNNINIFLDKFADRNWNKIDFKSYSKVLNPEIEKYDFSIDNILK